MGSPINHVVIARADGQLLQFQKRPATTSPPMPTTPMAKRYAVIRPALADRLGRVRQRAGGDHRVPQVSIRHGVSTALAHGR